MCWFGDVSALTVSVLFDWQSEAKFQEEQALQRKARGRVSDAEALASVAESSKTQGRMRSPCTSTLIDRKRPRHRDSRAAQDAFGTSWAHLQDLGEGDDRARAAEIDILYDGYFRGLFTGANGPAAEDVSTSNGNANARADSATHQHSNHIRTFPGETGSHTSLHGRRFANGGDQYNYEISSGRRFRVAMPESGRRFTAGRDYATYETSTGRPHGNTLYSNSGIASHSNTSQPGPSDATVVRVLSSQRGELGSRGGWMRPVPSMSTSGRSMAAPQNHHRMRDEVSLGDLSRHSLEGGDQVTSSTGNSRGSLGQTGRVSSGSSARPAGGRGGGASTGNAAVIGDATQDGGQILRGLKQRLLSFILQGIQNDDITSAVVRPSPHASYGSLQYLVLALISVL